MKKQGLRFLVLRALARQLQRQADFLFSLIGEEERLVMDQPPTLERRADEIAVPPAHWLQRVEQFAPASLATGEKASRQQQSESHTTPTHADGEHRRYTQRATDARSGDQASQRQHISLIEPSLEASELETVALSSTREDASVSKPSIESGTDLPLSMARTFASTEAGKTTAGHMPRPPRTQTSSVPTMDEAGLVRRDNHVPRTGVRWLTGRAQGDAPPMDERFEQLEGFHVKANLSPVKDDLFHARILPDQPTPSIVRVLQPQPAQARTGKRAFSMIAREDSSKNEGLTAVNVAPPLASPTPTNSGKDAASQFRHPTPTPNARFGATPNGDRTRGPGIDARSRSDFGGPLDLASSHVGCSAEPRVRRSTRYHSDFVGLNALACGAASLLWHRNSSDRVNILSSQSEAPMSMLGLNIPVENKLMCQATRQAANSLVWPGVNPPPDQEPDELDQQDDAQGDWPSLPAEALNSERSWRAAYQQWERQLRIDDEQRGARWNE